MLSDVLVAILPIQNVGDFVFARVLSLFVCRSGHLDKSLLLVYISHLVEWLVPEGSLLEVPSWWTLWASHLQTKRFSSPSFL